MICRWLEALAFADYNLACPAGEMPMIVGGWLGLVVAIAGVVWTFLFAASGPVRRLGALAGVLAALLFGVAAGLPELRKNTRPPEGGVLVVALDTSESVRRDGDAAYDIQRNALADMLERAIGDLPQEVRAGWRGGVVPFGSTASRGVERVPLAGLPASVRGQALGGADRSTDIAAGLDGAMDLIAADKGTGAIFVLTDGWATDGDTAAAALRARQSGIAVHVMPFGSKRPAMGIIASDLPAGQTLASPAVARLTLLGDGALDFAIDGAAKGSGQISSGSAAEPRGVRVDTRFDRLGINYLDLSFRSGGAQVVEQTERLFTLVRGPARILAYGGAPWLDAADERKYLIHHARPDEVLDLSTFDAIVVDGLQPSDFAAEFPRALINAAASGAGVFIVNGPKRGSVEDKQRISDWEATVLGPILPVNSNPDLQLAQPPRRDVLIMIDTSSSMGGSDRLADAKAAAQTIIARLRPVDTLIIIPYSDVAGTTFESNGMTEQSKNDAMGAIRNLSARGGTEPAAAIEAASRLKGNNCLFFFISDADFSAPGVSPVCYTTLIGVDDRKYDNGLASWGEEKTFSRGRVPSDIKFEAFTPQERKVFWREGAFRPVAPFGDAAFTPQATIDGIAYSYVRPEADLVAIHSAPPPDPVLAFRNDPEIRSMRTGVFLGAIPQAWANSTDGRAAIDAILGRLVSWSEQDRFDIHIRQEGAIFHLRLVFTGEGEPGESLSGSIMLADGQSVPAALQPASETGIFEGSARLSLGEKPQRGMLTLAEPGRKPQTIPFYLPAAAGGDRSGGRTSTAEALDFGINQAGLAALTRGAGGMDLSSSTPRLADSAYHYPDLPLWPSLAGIGLVLFAASLYGGGVRR